MKARYLLALAMCMAAIAASLMFLPSSHAAQSAKAAPAVARGQYLVERVSLCVDCHTEQGPQGPNRAKWLQGAAVPFKPIQPIPNWATVAPPLAGLPGFNEQQVARFLETATTPRGAPAAPPMPPYRMSRQDAVAVVAYLKSLGGK